LGFKTRKIRTGEKRVNVIGKLEPKKGPKRAKTIIFNGHMDVVPVADLDQWTIDPFEPKLRDGYLIGRGTEDMKGAIAACLTAAKAIVDGGFERTSNVEMHAV